MVSLEYELHVSPFFGRKTRRLFCAFLGRRGEAGGERAWGPMKTRELLIVMGTLGSTFVLLYGWPTLHRYEQTVDGRLVRISRVTHETRILEEGRGWVKPNQASKPRAQYCESTCPATANELENPWRPQASVDQPKSWTLSPQQQAEPRPKPTEPPDAR